ncbi:LysR family transcriptional regulator [Oceanobacillus arenosus]|uniref:LysR family transcriptional regulator n=1 Tax=Oceanobacillus arenosus TaxID=1229153 RepID=A0A3D8PJ84_9BACI|nr:LysR family transcriptional regulator [Oceanobacillus arenosus]RDW16114.1 LysR family transcriptional regulator [Oceanobacillus arenosus]
MVSKLDLYKVFTQVGKSKSFSAAAKDLYMTQPAVSQSIMQLERELDTRLFTRTTKGVTLTNEGQLLFEYANSAINLIDVGEEKILEFKNLTAGELKIGVGDTISKYFLLPYLEAFHNHFPNIKFNIINGTTSELCAILKSGEVDIAFCNFPVDEPRLIQIPCIAIHDIFVCGDKFQHLLTAPVTFEELTNEPLILLEQKSISRKYVDNFLSANGFTISPEIELGSHDLLLEFAKINLGVACVTKEFAKEYLENGSLFEVPLANEIPPRSIGMCYLNSVSLSPATTKFIESINVQ